MRHEPGVAPEEEALPEEPAELELVETAALELVEPAELEGALVEPCTLKLVFVEPRTVGVALEALCRVLGVRAEAWLVEPGELDPEEVRDVRASSLNEACCEHAVDSRARTSNGRCMGAQCSPRVGSERLLSDFTSTAPRAPSHPVEETPHPFLERALRGEQREDDERLGREVEEMARVHVDAVLLEKRQRPRLLRLGRG